MSLKAVQFLDRASAAERRQRTWRNSSIAASLVALVLVGMGSLALRSDARQAEATHLAVESQRIADDKPLRSLSLALTAAGLGQTLESEAALRRVLGSAYPRTVVHHDAAIVDAALSSDGSRLVTASMDGTAGLWDARTGQLGARLPHGQPVRATSILADGRIATLTENACRIWTASGAKAFEFHRKGGDLIQLTVSRDGSLIAAVDLKDKAAVWDLRGGPTRFLQASGATTIDFRPDNTVIVVTASGEIIDEDPLTGKAIGEPLHLPGVSPFGAALSQDGKVFAAAGTEGAFVWPSFDTSPNPVLLAGSSKHPVSSLILSRDGRWAVGVIAGTAHVWDAKTGREDWIVGDGIVIASLSPDGEAIATARNDGLVEIWNRATAELKKTLRFHTGFVRQLRFSADGGSLVSAGDEGAAIWDLLAAPPDTSAMSFGALRSATAALLPAGVSFDAKGHLIER